MSLRCLMIASKRSACLMSHSVSLSLNLGTSELSIVHRKCSFISSNRSLSVILNPPMLDVLFSLYKFLTAYLYLDEHLLLRMLLQGFLPTLHDSVCFVAPIPQSYLQALLRKHIPHTVSVRACKRRIHSFPNLPIPAPSFLFEYLIVRRWSYRHIVFK